MPTQKKWKFKMWITAALLFHILGFVSSINAVMTVRTSQGAIAWAISLNTMPYIAVPAYWVLGRSKFDGYSTARQSSDAKVQEKLRELYDGLKEYTIAASDLAPASMAAEKLTYIPYLKGNDLDLLIDGDAIFNSIVDGIDKAQ
ncbi:MAG: cardiolipin synthase, partial [Campylobacterota bacterium]|nr:cardiolipin synthase [Campylobacterota bacterium]